MTGFLRIAIVASILLGGVISYALVDGPDANSALPVAQNHDFDAARFEVTLRHGVLTLDGDTVSSEHERQLLQKVEDSYPGIGTNVSLAPRKVTPDDWATTTMNVLEALLAMRLADAIMTEHSLRIRGVGTADWPLRLERLRATVPGTLKIDVDVVVPDQDIRVEKLCARAVASFTTGPVYFEESATRLRSSAFGALDRAISLADACRDSTVSITGHTDSSGYEPSNQQLSVTRARLVADYFEEHGIARERLKVAGAGSSLPVADNGTRFGRSLNRRITIELRQGGGAEER